MRIKDWHKENKKYFTLSELNFIFKSLLLKPDWDLFFSQKCLTKNQLKKLINLKKLHLKGMPLGLALNKEEFFGNTFFVNSNTLIPRPETELLVEKAAQISKENKLKTVLDLGCGCGNIGISLDKLLPYQLDIYLSDVSRQAVSLAKKNALKLGSKVKTVVSDLFCRFRPGYFDLIITNPPYVETGNIKGSLLYEPKIALNGGSDGLSCIKKILNQAHSYLKSNRYLLFEFGCNQKERIELIIQKSRHYKIKEWIKDYAGIWRGVVLQNG